MSLLSVVEGLYIFWCTQVPFSSLNKKCAYSFGDLGKLYYFDFMKTDVKAILIFFFIVQLFQYGFVENCCGSASPPHLSVYQCLSFHLIPYHISTELELSS